MNENKVKVWIARDKSGELFLSSERPNKMENYWGSEVYTEIFRLDSSLFPSVKWKDDEPTEAYITLANEPQEQPKKEIDWEQRKYEIIRDNLFHCPITDDFEAYKEYLTIAVKRAEILIKELKKQDYENDKDTFHKQGYCG